MTASRYSRSKCWRLSRTAGSKASALSRSVRSRAISRCSPGRLQSGSFPSYSWRPARTALSGWAARYEFMNASTKAFHCPDFTGWDAASQSAPENSNKPARNRVNLAIVFTRFISLTSPPARDSHSCWRVRIRVYLVHPLFNRGDGPVSPGNRSHRQIEPAECLLKRQRYIGGRNRRSSGTQEVAYEQEPFSRHERDDHVRSVGLVQHRVDRHRPSRQLESPAVGNSQNSRLARIVLQAIREHGVGCGQNRLEVGAASL